MGPEPTSNSPQPERIIDARPNSQAYAMSVVSGLEGPAFGIGYKILAEKGDAIIGMSVGNSYFTEQVLNNLLPLSNQLFSSVRIFVTDVPARHTFEALGYDSRQAESKARLRGNAIRNKCLRASASEQITCDFVDWKSDVEANNCYIEARTRIDALYRNSAGFGEAVQKAALEVIANSSKTNIDPKTKIDIAAQYLIEELAYLDVAPEIHGIAKYAYIYHRPWPIFEHFVAGDFDGRTRDKLGIVLIR